MIQTVISTLTQELNTHLKIVLKLDEEALITKSPLSELEKLQGLDHLI